MKYKKIICIILIIMWMATIFYFSHQTSEESSGTSKGTIETILNMIPQIRQMPELEKAELIESLQHIVRKLAHFSIYTLGGILIFMYANTCNIIENKKILYSWLAGTMYALTDEIHQIFIPRKKL